MPTVIGETWERIEMINDGRIPPDATSAAVGQCHADVSIGSQAVGHVATVMKSLHGEALEKLHEQCGRTGAHMVKRCRGAEVQIGGG